jgi:hypothetical protein
VEDHECGPECETSASDYRRARAAALIAAYDEDKRDALLQAALGTIERSRKNFEGFTQEQLGDVLEVIGEVISQIMTTPAYALSDTLTDSSTVYTLASAHLLAGFKLPEKAEDLPEHSGDTTPLPAIQADVPSYIGMYL